MSTAEILGTVYERAVTQVELRGDGRTVEALIVPWNRPTPVGDIIGGRLVDYREQFARGAFALAEQAPRKVFLAFGHSNAFGDTIGRAEALHATAEGEVGVFTLDPTTADKARHLIADLGLSVSFRSITPTPGTERAGQLITRAAVHLIHVAAVAMPAYPDARILAMRADNEAAARRAAMEETTVREMTATLSALRESGHTLRDWQTAYLAEHEGTTA